MLMIKKYVEYLNLESIELAALKSSSNYRQHGIESFKKFILSWRLNSSVLLEKAEKFYFSYNQGEEKSRCCTYEKLSET